MIYQLKCIFPQVTWSDGNVTETYKTYQALRNFHAEVSVQSMCIFPENFELLDSKRCPNGGPHAFLSSCRLSYLPIFDV